MGREWAGEAGLLNGRYAGEVKALVGVLPRELSKVSEVDDEERGRDERGPLLSLSTNALYSTLDDSSSSGPARRGRGERLISGGGER